jgi:hypothetical protein
MKKLLLSLSALVILGLPKLMAQDTIPNLGFEIWTANTFSAGNAPDPNTGNASNGWWDFNVFSNSTFLGGSPITVFEGSTNPHQGLHYAEIVSNQMTLTSYGYLKKYGYNYARTNGLMFLAYLNVGFTGAVIKAGVPINNALKSFSFFYRYMPNGSDSCSCTIGMYHWNSVTSKRELIGGGFWSSPTRQTNWTMNTVPILYDSTSIPDTVFVLFSACKFDSANAPNKNDTLDIDAASIVLGVNNLTLENSQVHVYPNPANEQITVAVTSQIQATRVEVYDITGKLVNTYTMHNNSLTINTQPYSSGMYFYKLFDNTGTQLNTGKFSVVR